MFRSFFGISVLEMDIIFRIRFQSVSRNFERKKKRREIMSRILIIEDEQDMAAVVRERFQGEGFEVDVASEGWKGIEFAHKRNPDLIILDLMVPVGDGLWILKTLREKPDTKDILIVVLTGIDDKGYKQKVLDEGVNAYIQKPYDGDELVKTIQGILNPK